MSQRQDASSGGVRRKVLMTCYFSAAQERALRTLTARTSVPMAVYVGLVLERETTARLRDSLSVADQLAGVPRG